jgi:hypothetical protein
VARCYGYLVRFLPVGPDDPEVGPPTQMAVLTRSDPEPPTRTAGSRTAGSRTTGSRTTADTATTAAARAHENEEGTA